MKIDLLTHLKDNPFVLAPMAGITDCAFRSFMRELSCGIVITELVSAHGLEFNSQRTRRLMEFDTLQRPVGIQIFGDSPEVLALGAKMVEEARADFVDLNFGCPVTKVVRKGSGSAILKDLNQVEKVFRAVVKATPLPVTVKIRTGWDESSRNSEKLVEIAYNEGLTWVAIHGRTRAAAYSGRADWEYIGNVKAKSKIPVIGNGDLHSAEMAVRRLQETGCEGVMIGRGCLKNPWIFKQAQHLWRGRSAAADISPRPSEDYLELFWKLKQVFEAKSDVKVTTLQLKKFASWYASGYPGASQFRKKLFQSQTLEEVVEYAQNFFSELRSYNQADTSEESFLMGGHG